MSNIEKIKAEIEKRREFIKAYCLNPNHDKRYDVVPEQLAYILSFIDFLPEEKPTLTVEDIKTILDISFWNSDPEKILEEYNRLKK